MHLLPEEYFIGIRLRNKDFVFENKYLLKDFIFLKNSFLYWSADPFVLELNGDTYIFVERFNRLTSKGHLAFSKLSNTHKNKIKFTKCSKENIHFSFPAVYSKNNEIYILPETHQKNSVWIYRFDLFKKTIFPLKELIKGSKFVDSVFINKNLITYNISDKNCPYLEYFMKTDGGFTKKIKIGDENKKLRGAGKVFEYKGDLIYPSQDCSKEYGYGIFFNKLSFERGLTIKEFDYINAKDVSLILNKKIDGIHTYNFTEKVEIIDITVRKFNILGIIGKIIVKAKRLFRKK